MILTWSRHDIGETQSPAFLPQANVRLTLILGPLVELEQAIDGFDEVLPALYLLVCVSVTVSIAAL